MNRVRVSTLRVRGARVTLVAMLAAAVASGTEADLEHFEKRVRPLLVEHCHACHSADAPSVFAGLRLDSRQGLLVGGDSGPAVVPGDSRASPLLQAVRGDGKTPMPPTGRLGDEQIRDLAIWVDAGSPWPDEAASGLSDPSEEFDLEKRRAEHWAWLPVRTEAAPQVGDESWVRDDLDRYILAKLEEHDLEPAKAADRATLLRRLSYVLTGLPPMPSEIREFLADDSPEAVETVVERLIASPHYGERWARHWMDLFRYTESHGSEGDPDVREAWRYRDYVIRALNSDVPYDTLIREHIAGDLLDEPRLSPDGGLNESLLATAHYRMIEHGFQPVDPWEDRVKWTDNQIDVFSKAFQGLTVSCARCHDHKFDAISQKDYYALFGVFANAKPVQRAVDAPALLHRNEDALRSTKAGIREALASIWLEAADGLAERLLASDADMARLIADAACEPNDPLYPWVDLTQESSMDLAEGWRKLVSDWSREISRRESYNQEHFEGILRLGQDGSGWQRFGTGVGEGVSEPGEFSVLPAGDRIVEGIYEPGVHSGLLSRRHDGVLHTPRFVIDTDRISFRVQGSGLSVVRLIIENYAVPRGGIYYLRYSPVSDEPVWTSWDTKYWKGFSAYVEFATVNDSTNFVLDSFHARLKPRPTIPEDGRSHFGTMGVAFHNEDHLPLETETATSYLMEGVTPSSSEDLAALYASRLREAVVAWRTGAMTAPQAAYLDWAVRRGLLPSSLGVSDALDQLVSKYRQLEEGVPIPRRAPGVYEEAGPDAALLVRGDHNNRGEPVPRRYLAALESQPYDDPSTVRLRLAEEVASPRNPLTARVMVNRIWRYMFGRGLVSTVDNFGKVGSAPSHPQLLDYLADQFVGDGWSIKRMIRRIALSAAFQMDSEPSAASLEQDPGNALLQHMGLRRLEGEAIRDTLLAVSGRFDPTMHGPSVNVYYAFAKGKTKGDRVKGPLDGAGRRSVYQEIRRNAHNPFLEVFDQPKPSSTRGQRDVTNVPAQSLTMLNSPFVVAQAEHWGKALAARDDPVGDTVQEMFLKAFGRLPSPSELDQSLGYVGDAPDADRWADLAHALFNLKEFVYVR